MKRLAFLLVALCLSSPALAQGFRTPTGNIHCAVVEGGLRCDIGVRSYPVPPARERCELDRGGFVAMGPRGRAVLPCAGDTVADPSLPVLPYGSEWRAGDFRCASERTGVTCRNADGRGWEMSRSALRLF